MQGNFLSSCLDSIISQRDQVSCEIILVDNNSTDCTKDVIQSYENYIDHVITEPDSGQTNAINKGLALATGDYINWLCCDDVLHKGALASIKENFDAHVGCHVVCGLAEIYQNSSKIAQIRSSRLAKNLPVSLAFARVVQPATFWKRCTFDHFSPLDENLHFVMDLDLWLRYLAIHGSSHVLFVDSLLCKVNLHDSCKSVKHAQLFAQEIDLVVDRLITSWTAPDGSFAGFGQSYNSSNSLRDNIKKIKQGSFLARKLRTPLTLDRHELIQIASNLKSVLWHLASVRPEVLKMYS